MLKITIDSYNDLVRRLHKAERECVNRYQLADALSQTVSWIEECGSDYEGRQFVLTEARAALRGLKLVDNSVDFLSIVARVAHSIDKAMSEQLDPTPGHLARAAIRAMQEVGSAGLMECPTCLRRFRAGECCELDTCSLSHLHGVGLDWKLSDEAQDQIAEIESNSRNAMLNADELRAGNYSDQDNPKTNPFPV